MNNVPFTLPELSYGYDDLAPSISAEIMQLHHSKHHQTYVDKFNATIESSDALKGKSLTEILSNVSEIDPSIRQAVINFGGGHYNHSLFWQYMAPNAGGEPKGDLAIALNNKYGSFQGFVDEFNKMSLSVFGSGWSWLMPDLSIITSANQDTPIMNGKPEPILGLDVWEHAYYLDYKNKRDDYVRSWWNVVNWDEVQKRYEAK